MNGKWKSFFSLFSLFYRGEWHNVIFPAQFLWKKKLLSFFFASCYFVFFPFFSFFVTKYFFILSRFFSFKELKVFSFDTFLNLFLFSPFLIIFPTWWTKEAYFYVSDNLSQSNVWKSALFHPNQKASNLLFSRVPQAFFMI